MKILLVTTFLPLKYNCHGPNQLLYSLLKVLGRHATIDMLYYELNNEKLTVKSDFSNVNFLGVISPKKLSLYYWFFSKRISLFEFPVPKNINIGDYDCIWLYPEWLYSDWKKESARIVITGMDSTFLLYLRSFLSNSKLGLIKKTLFLIKSILLEKSINNKHLFHSISPLDISFFRLINKNSKILSTNHPLFLDNNEITNNYTINLRQLIVGFSGGLSEFYNANLFDRFFTTILRNQLASSITFRFLGNAWKNYAKMLKDAEYNVIWDKWVDSYENDFLSKIDSQVILLACGAGIKTKVVSALAMGKYIIGTDYAFDGIPNDIYFERVIEPEEAAYHVDSLTPITITNKANLLKSNTVNIFNHFDEITCGLQFLSGLSNYLEISSKTGGR